MHFAYYVDMCSNYHWHFFEWKSQDYISHFNWIWKKLAKLRSFKSVIVIGVLESLCTSEFLKPYLRKSTLIDLINFRSLFCICYFYTLGISFIFSSQIDVQEVLREPPLWAQWWERAISLSPVEQVIIIIILNII